MTRDVPDVRLRPGAALLTTAIGGVLAGLVAVVVEPVPGLGDPGTLVRTGLPLTRVLLDMAAVITVGMCLLPLLLGADRPKRAEPVVRIARTSAMIGALAWAATAVVALVLQTAELHPDRGVSGAAIVDYVQAVAAGKALAFVAALALVVFALTAWPSGPAELRAAIALLTLLPLPVTGHAATWRWQDITTVSIELHVLAAAAWTGGLAAIAVLLVANRTLLAVALPRFSRLATACLVGVSVTGLVNAGVELSSAPGRDLVGAVFGTTYGLLVLGKLLCVGALAATGAVIRWRLMPGVLAQRRTALLTWATAELAIMGLAFAVAVTLTRVPLT